MKINPKEKYSKIFFKSLIGGVGWAFGVTLGFAFLVYLLSFVLQRLGGLPLIGNWIAGLVEATSRALEIRKTLP